VAVGDFNRDGVPDLAVANFNSNDVSVLLGNGDGTFHLARSFGVAMNPDSVAVGDFNSDGIPDLAVGNRVYLNTDGVSVLLGNGDGTFRAARNFSAGGQPLSVAVGDFNRDGMQDLAVSNWLPFGDHGPFGNVTILLGDGDGRLQEARSFDAGNGPSSVAVGEFNGDGVPDLAVADLGSFPDQFGSVSILLGNGDGTFQAGQVNMVGRGAIAVAIGDFNADGAADLAVAEEGYYVYHPEIDDYVFVPGTTVSILLGMGQGTFEAPRSISVGLAPYSLAIGDFNRDGMQDLVVANSAGGNVSVLLGNGDGSFRTAVNYPAGRSPYSVAVGDFNGDGVLDLAVANSIYAAGTVSVLLGNGDGSFRTAVNYAAGSAPNSVAVGDFNGDGISDVAVANALSNDVSVLLGNGDGSFQPARNFDASNAPCSVAVGDFNRDGVPDLAIANCYANDVSVLLGNGDGSFQPAQNFGAGNYPNSVAVADFNADGLPDLAVANLSFSNVSVLVNNTPSQGGVGFAR
jgi:hypothetical protein